MVKQIGIEMTIPKNAELIHAFADGKVLQFKRLNEWFDWEGGYLPAVHLGGDWRIKPDEPKKGILRKLRHSNGCVIEGIVGSDWYNTMITSCRAIPIPQLDREVTLEE